MNRRDFCIIAVGGMVFGATSRLLGRSRRDRREKELLDGKEGLCFWYPRRQPFNPDHGLIAVMDCATNFVDHKGIGDTETRILANADIRLLYLRCLKEANDPIARHSTPAPYSRFCGTPLEPCIFYNSPFWRMAKGPEEMVIVGKHKYARIRPA